jgi:(S)-2-hydroxy-acid oxidase
LKLYLKRQPVEKLKLLKLDILTLIKLSYSIRLKPRVLRDVSNRSISTKVLDRLSALPFGIAPTASHKLAHPVGEVATAKAAQEKGAVFILSMASSCSIEKVAASAPSVRKWMQLCIFKDRAVTENLIKRSEAAGFEALVLTVDRPVLGIRNIKVNITTSLPNMEYQIIREIIIF